MSLSCDLDGWPEFYSEQEVVARKERRCVECSAPILKGERYLRYSGKWDGDVSGGAQHLLCRDACVWIRDILNGDEGCIPFGALHEWWADCGRDPSSSMGSIPWKPGAFEERLKRWRPLWRIGARMYAMIRRRERLARKAA